MSEDETPEGTSAPAGAVVIVAHPDDETLWAGGTMLMHPAWPWAVAALCRGSDPDRAPKFFKAMARLRAAGCMADLDDGPEQSPLPPAVVQEAVLSLLPGSSFDLILTHSPFGEYTRHLRHEEAAQAVLAVWEARRLSTNQLWMFAYADGHRRHLPRPIASAHRMVRLPENIWLEKHAIITDVYGYGGESFEARTTPRQEAFWCFESPAAVRAWMQGKVMER
ncbi:MAG: hypothetical protein AMJ81_03490 [Phycisphaerae bacterium SM23_33]|nr:MAG: hypothetical protein AMJ81_03490 [Phycisphaerae bacterium SM23_33]